MNKSAWEQAAEYLTTEWMKSEERKKMIAEVEKLLFEEPKNE